MPKDLKQWVQLEGEDVYFRPLLAKSKTSRGNVFIVGINPATPMKRADFQDMNEYIELLYNRSRFMERMQEVRIRDGKSSLSRTRIGLNEFVRDLEAKSHGVIEVIETNVNTYPTEQAEMLKSTPTKLVEHGYRIFHEVLVAYQPEVIIVHSVKAVRELVRLLESERMVPYQTFRRKLRLNDWIKKGPIPFTYWNGESGTIFCAPHFKNHGKAGTSFEPLKKQILQSFG